MVQDQRDSKRAKAEPEVEVENPAMTAAVQEVAAHTLHVVRAATVEEAVEARQVLEAAPATAAVQDVLLLQFRNLCRGESEIPFLYTLANCFHGTGNFLMHRCFRFCQLFQSLPQRQRLFFLPIQLLGVH